MKRIWRKSQHIIFIKDEENARIIWTLATSWDGVWLEMNGELIRFTKRGEDSYYQREYEQEKHSIDCLDDYYYGMSGVGFHKLAVEDGKINLPCGMEAWLYMAAMDVTQVLTLSCGAII